MIKKRGILFVNIYIYEHSFKKHFFLTSPVLLNIVVHIAVGTIERNQESKIRSVVSVIDGVCAVFLSE